MNREIILVLAVICILVLPFECRRFYRVASRGDFPLWPLVDVVLSITIIVSTLLELS